MKITINSKEYKIGKELGKGGNGQVFQAFNEEENKYYAIKKILIKDLNEEDKITIKTEIKILSNFADTNNHIVKYYGSSLDNEALYILMEFCEGINLKKYIAESKTLIDENIVYNIVLEICLGIKEMHNNKILHRNLKPENIFIDKNNNIKIGNLGISRQLINTKKYASKNKGAINYMAPEVIKGEKYNTKVDIWDFGCIIYELLTREICFEGKELSCIPKILSGKNGKIDVNKYKPQWQKLIDILLQLDFNERPDIEWVYNFIIKKLKEINDSKKNN